MCRGGPDANGAERSIRAARGLIDAPAGPLRERTWCFWEQGDGDFGEVVAKSWERLCVRGPGGQVWESRPHPWRYKMIRSSAFDAFVDARLTRSPLAERVTATVHRLTETADGVLVSGTLPGGRQLSLRAGWVYDSRPLPRLPPARTTLLQHFRGWFVQLDTGKADAASSFDPDSACLMDFRTPQPEHGLSFGYVLPLGPNRALVEYTEFSETPLPTEAYDAALRHYTSEILKLGTFDVLDTEQGIIPMTDARFQRQVGRHVFRIGTSGGATRPATGYTFAAVQRQSRAIADSYRSEPCRLHHRRMPGDRSPWTPSCCVPSTRGG